MFRAAAKRPRPSAHSATAAAVDSLCAAMICPPSASADHILRPPQPTVVDLASQHVAAALAAVMQVRPQLRAATSADFGGSSSASRSQREQRQSQHQQRRSYRRSSHRQPTIIAVSECAPCRGGDSVHQTGTGYRSNNAGDGPEKTRDRKSWFPRFKSNWLGTYRSKQMFHCCECAVADAPSARYKGSEGKHCACGQDQWHLAKTIEEAEYNRRMEISKALGGLRYDEALERLKAMGTSEHDLKRLRCESDEASVASSCSSVDDHADVDSAMHSSKRIKNEPGLERSAPLPSPATRAYGSSLQRKLSASSSFGLDPVPTGGSGATLTAELLQKINSHHSYSSGLYTPLSGDYLSDHLVPAPFADEEGFGELLQGFLEDDPRGSYSSHYPQPAPQQQQQSARLTPASSSARSAQPYGGYSTPFLPGSGSNDHHQQQQLQQPHHEQHQQQQLLHQRYPQAPSTLPPPPQGDVDFEFFPDGHPRTMMAPAQQQAAGYYPHSHSHLHHHHHHHHAQSEYARPHLAHPHHVAVVASPSSFSIV